MFNDLRCVFWVFNLLSTQANHALPPSSEPLSKAKSSVFVLKSESAAEPDPVTVLNKPVSSVLLAQGSFRRSLLLFTLIRIITNIMAICITCQNYYRQSQYNDSQQCDECVDSLEVPLFDEEDTLEVEHLLHPSGKTPARFYE